MPPQTTLLPPELIGRDVETLTLRHPKTRHLRQFAATESALFQKVRVGAQSTASPHSLLFDNAVASSAEIHVYIPVNANFFILPALFAGKDRFLPLDLLLEMESSADANDDDCDALPAHLFTALQEICLIENDMYKLDLERLAAWFSARVADTQVPQSLAAKYSRAIAPMDPTQKVEDSLQTAVMQHAMIELICSWLPENIANWLRTQHDFTALNAHVEALQSGRAAALALQKLTEPAAASAKRARQPAKKLKPTNNKSMLDFFKKR